MQPLKEMRCKARDKAILTFVDAIAEKTLLSGLWIRSPILCVDRFEDRILMTLINKCNSIINIRTNFTGSRLAKQLSADLRLTSNTEKLGDEE